MSAASTLVRGGPLPIRVGPQSFKLVEDLVAKEVHVPAGTTLHLHEHDVVCDVLCNDGCDVLCNDGVITR